MSDNNPKPAFVIGVRRIVAALMAWFSLTSERFDAWIARLLARAVAAVEKTSLADNPRIAGWINALRSSDARPADIDGGIVTHADLASKSDSSSDVSAKAVRLLSGGSRVALLSLVALVLIWSWPKGDGPAASRAAARNTPTPVATISLAIINPANMGDAEPQQPSIVTIPGAGTAQNAPVDTGVEAPMVVVNTLPGSKLFDAMQATGRNDVNSQMDDPPLVADIASEALQPTPAAVAAAASDQQEPGQVVLIDADMAGADPQEFAVPTPVAPFVNIVSTINFDFTPTPVPQPTPDAPPTPTPVPVKLEPGRLWSNFEPKADNEHFWVERPFSPQVRGQLASPNYQFGSTAGGRYRIHHGMDISNPMGTPVRAATTGEVIHAGWDDPELIGPYNGFYGNSVVIQLDQRLPVAGGEMNVYLVYGHMNEVLVEEGQRVEPDDIVGRVGMSGIAIGPHLHVEMRLGANTYEHSVDPYLWVQPKDNAGAVAVRLLTADGRTWPGARLSLARFEGGKAVWARVIETYRDGETIGPDPVWGENGAMGSVPPGYYILAGSVNGESVRTEIVVEPEKTTFVELRTTQ